MVRPRKIDRAKLKELVEQGLSDREIAERFGVHPMTIAQIRANELGIRKLPQRKDKESPETEFWIIKEQGIVIEYLIRLTKEEVLELIKRKLE